MASPFGRPETVIFQLLHATSITTQVLLDCSAVMCVCVHYVSVCMVGWAQLMDEEMKGWAPIGVVGAIVPWNFPLMLLTWKVRPCEAKRETVPVCMFVCLHAGVSGPRHGEYGCAEASVVHPSHCAHVC